MTADMILTIAVVATVALFAAVGLVRTAQREIFVTAAVLGAAALVDARGEAWASVADDLLPVGPDTARFVVEAALFGGSALLLGYFAGSLAGPVSKTPGRRVAGALLAAFNASLLLSYLLDAFYVFMAGAADRNILVSSSAAMTLRNHLDVIFISGMVGTILVTLVALVLALRRPARLPAGRTFPGPARGLDAPERSLTVEPPVRPGARTVALDQTMPLPAMDATRVGDGGGRRETPRFRGGTNGEWAKIEPRVGRDATDAAGTRCRSCGAAVPASDVYCPECGNLTR